MDPLEWLGLRKPRDSHPNLAAVQEAVRGLLPDDEPVVVRYIVIVSVLLTRVAYADGMFLQSEQDHLRDLLHNIDRLPPEGIDALCDILHRHVPKLDADELELCFRELRALCDATERRQVMRLLATQATVDGTIVASEHGSLMEIAEALHISEADMEELEIEALSNSALPVAVHDTLPPESVNGPATKR